MAALKKSKEVSFARTCAYCGGIGCHQPRCDRPAALPSSRIVADRLWRSAPARKQFEAETGLTDPTTEAYQKRFNEWAIPADVGGSGT